MLSLHISLLGHFSISCDGKVISSLRQARVRALLAYLLLHRHAPQSRQMLAAQFWPDTFESQARTNLRQLLHHLQRALPDAVQLLHIGATTVQWRPQVACSLDVAEFEDQVSRADQATQTGSPEAVRTALEAAAQIYSGDLFPECYDDWLLAERERLRQTFGLVLERLILIAEDQRDYQAAIGFAERLLRHDPMHEQTYRRLMRLHAINGDRALAVRVYHACAVTLERELGIGPNTDTQEAYQRLLNMELPAVLRTRTPNTNRAPLVGRHSEWQHLRKLWRSSASGTAALVAITGEAGIGKTRLVEEALTWAGQQGICLALTRSYAAEGRLAYAPVIDWLRAPPLHAALAQLDDVWLVEVSRLLPELLVKRRDLVKPAPLSENWQRTHLFEALTRAVLAVSEPLLLVLDDAQWADPDTLEWLGFLLHYAPKAHLMLVVVVRAEELDGAHAFVRLAQALQQRGQFSAIELGPLDTNETVTLAEQVAGRPLTSEQLARLSQQAEGNPLFVVEMVRTEANAELSATGGKPIGIGGVRPLKNPVIPGPTRIQAVIAARLRQLSPAARDLAGLAATIGRAFSIRVLARASALDEEKLVQALDELWQRRIVREQGDDSYDFSHDRLREGAYTNLSTARRRLFHRRVASALEHVFAANLDSVSGQIATHYDRAGVAEKAIAYYLRAAGVAQETFSFDAVIDLANSALDLLATQPDTPDRAQVEYSLLMMLVLARQMSRGYVDHISEQLLLRADLLCTQLGDPVKTITVLSALWLPSHLRGDMAQAWQIAERLEQVVRQTAATWYSTVVHFSLVGTAFFRGDLTTTERYIERGLALDDEQHYALQMRTFGYIPGVAIRAYGSHNAWLRGYPNIAFARGLEALELANASGQAANRAFVLSMMTVLYQLCGDIAQTKDHARQALAFAEEQSMAQWIVHNRIIESWALARADPAGTGIDDLVYEIEIWQASGSELALPYYKLLLSDAYTHAGRHESALEELSQGLVIAERGEQHWMDAELHRQRGEIILAQGADLMQVERCYQQATAIARSQQARSFELRATISLSRLYQLRGQLTAAHQLLREAYDWFTEGFETADLRAAATLLYDFEDSSASVSS